MALPAHVIDATGSQAHLPAHALHQLDQHAVGRNWTINSSNLNGTNSTMVDDVVDVMDPGYAVLLMYLLLVCPCLCQTPRFRYLGSCQLMGILLHAAVSNARHTSWTSLLEAEAQKVVRAGKW